MHDVRLFKCHIIFIVILYQFDFSMQGKSLSLTKNMACTIINLLILGTISVNMQVRAIQEIRMDTTKVIELKIYKSICHITIKVLEFSCPIFFHEL